MLKAKNKNIIKNIRSHDRNFFISTKIVLVVILGLVILLSLLVFMYSHASLVSTFLFGYAPQSLPTNNANSWRLIPPQKDPSKTSGPTFSLDYAKAYITAHPFHNGITTTGKSPIIEQLYVTTDADVAKILEHDPGVSPDAKVLVVIVKGPFSIPEAGLPGNNKVPIANEIIEIFDAHTGLLRMWEVKS